MRCGREGCPQLAQVAIAGALSFQWVRRLSRRVREIRLLGTAAILCRPLLSVWLYDRI